MSVKIKISVIIPVYNVEKYLKECLDSVANQTLKDIEIICINDGSPDNSLAILEEYAKNDNRIVIIDKENQGVSIARNDGIKKATGEFIAFLDPDDKYASDDVLEALYSGAKDNNVNICGGELLLIDEKGELIKTKESNKIGQFFEKCGHIEYKDFQDHRGYTRYIFKKDMLKENKIYFPNLIRFQDPPFFVDAMIAAQKFYALNKVVYHYRKDHKTINWNQKRVYALLSGIFYIYKIAYKNKYNKLQTEMLNAIKAYKHFIFKNTITFKLFVLYAKISLHDKTIRKYCKKNKASFLRLLRKKVYSKHKKENGKRKIYLFGIKILSYKKQRKYTKKTIPQFAAPKDNKVLIIEVQNHHGECLPSYIKYFNELGYDVDLLVNKQIIKDNPFVLAQKSLKYNLIEASADDFHAILKDKRILQYPHVLLGTAIYNYKDKSFVLDTFPLLQKLKSLFIIEHRLENYDKNSKYGKILTLWDFDKGTMINPHYFGSIKPHAKNKKTKFVVVGMIAGERKNHNMLIDAIKEISQKTTNFEVSIIGKGELKDLPVEIHPFINIKGRLSFEDMYQEMQDADYFLPLLDANNPEHERYLKTGVTGSAQLIYGFATPPLIHKKFADFYKFNDENAIVYEDDFAQAMLDAIELSNEQYNNKVATLAADAKYIYKESLFNLKFAISHPACA